MEKVDLLLDSSFPKAQNINMRNYLFVFILFISAIFSIPAFPMGGTAPTPPSATYQAPAANVQVINVIAKQFEFIPNTINVKRGIPVRIILTSQDDTHGFAIDDLKINVSVEKGKQTIVDFTPNKSGTYEFYCSVFCGLGHMGMRGKLIVGD
jgi:heme/copper-type cytochrome/quinol oxidase subunit 2